MNTWVFGDIHGAGLETEKLINIINFSYPHNRFVFVGDAIDRGKHGHIVWKLIKKYDIPVCLGNHENKMIQFLSGEREYLPKHYYWALNNLVQNDVDIEEFYEWLISLPLLIPSENNSKKYIITHAGVNLKDPYKTDISANVYGNLDSEKAMPKPKDRDKEVFWWDMYDKEQIIIYGHLVTQDNALRIRRNFNGHLNSIGIDTAVVHGGNITAYCLENGVTVQYCSGKDWFGELKKEIGNNIPILDERIRKFINEKTKY